MPEPKLRLEMPAQPRFLNVASAFVRSAASQAGFDEEATEALEIAAMEAVENVMDHSGVAGRDTVRVLVWQGTGEFFVEIQDRGVPWPPEVLTGRIGQVMPPVSAERGRGLAMMRALVDRVVLGQAHGVKSLRLVKRLQGVGAAGPAAD